MEHDHSDTNEQKVGRRERSRLRARLQAKIVTLCSTRSTMLLDLSQSGARIKASAEMQIDEEIVLGWAQYEAFGKIVWLKDGMCGIAFDKPISSQSLVATRNYEQLPSDLQIEREHAREWVLGLRRV